MQRSKKPIILVPSQVSRNSCELFFFFFENFYYYLLLFFFPKADNGLVVAQDCNS